MNECSATRIDCRLYDGFHVSGWTAGERGGRTVRDGDADALVRLEASARRVHLDRRRAERVVRRERDAAKVHPAVVRRVRRAQQDKVAVQDVRRVEPRDDVLLRVLRELLELDRKALFVGGRRHRLLVGFKSIPIGLTAKCHPDSLFHKQFKLVYFLAFLDREDQYCFVPRRNLVSR